MTFQCGDCMVCGKCYPKRQDCPACGGEIVLDEMDRCPVCGHQITDDLRERARRAFMQEKREEHLKLFPLAAKLPQYRHPNSG